MVEQGKRQLLYAWTKGELRKGGDAPSLHQGGRSRRPRWLISICVCRGDGGRGWDGGTVVKESRCHGGHN